MPADAVDAANILILDAALSRACSNSRRHVIESALAMLPPLTLGALCDLCSRDLLKGGCDVTSISVPGVVILAVFGVDGAAIVGVSASWGVWGVSGRWGVWGVSGRRGVSGASDSWGAWGTSGCWGGWEVSGCWGVCGVSEIGEVALARGELAGWSSNGGGAGKSAIRGCDFSKLDES